MAHRRHARHHHAYLEHQVLCIDVLDHSHDILRHIRLRQLGTLRRSKYRAKCRELRHRFHGRRRASSKCVLGRLGLSRRSRSGNGLGQSASDLGYFRGGQTLASELCRLLGACNHRYRLEVEGTRLGSRVHKVRRKLFFQGRESERGVCVGGSECVQRSERVY